MIYQSVLFTALTFIYSTIHATESVDLQSVLSAEISCCPSHAASQQDCESESYSNCAWLPADDPVVLNTPSGSQCLGEAYIQCKRANVNGCCGPCCNCPPETPSPLPSGVTPQPITAPLPPVCTPPSPTECALGENYAFEGQACTIMGDPHTTMFNGNRHDIMGTPWINFGTEENPLYRNQFYYVKSCIKDRENTDKMPIAILGTHHRLGTSHALSGLYYLTVELTDSDGKVYFVYLSWDFRAYAMESAGVGSDYDLNSASDMTSFSANSAVSVGNRFEVVYTEDAAQRALDVKITIDGTEEVTIYQYAQGCIRNGRYVCHYAAIALPSSLKCRACGLCGDFNRLSTGTGLTVQYMEGCDGSDVPYRDGHLLPEAYDSYGWTWEKHFVEDTCEYNYDVTGNSAGVDTSDPCPAHIQLIVDEECQRQYDLQSNCCQSIGGTFCEDALRDCKTDVCLLIENDVSKIATEVEDMLTNAIVETCNNAMLSQLMNGAPDIQLFDAEFEYKSTEQFGDETVEIGWIKYSQCSETVQSMKYPTAPLADMVSLARYAVTVKILPKNDIPGHSETSEYALTADICSNPVFALNNGKELSYELDLNTGLISGVSDTSSWIGSAEAVDRVRNGCVPTRLNDVPRDLSGGIIFHGSCNAATGIHLYSSACQWQYKQIMDPQQDIVVWLGFHTSKTKKCERYTDLFDTPFAHVSHQTFKNGETEQIGWIEFSECDEYPDRLTGIMKYPTLPLAGMINLAQYAVSVKILPKGDVPGHSETDAFAVTAEYCSNPVFALNNGKELSFTLDLDTLKIAAKANTFNWIGTDEAVDRTRNGCSSGTNPVIGGDARNLPVIYAAPCNQNGLHLYSSSCQWQFKQVMDPQQDVSVWLGFHTSRRQQCEEYTQFMPNMEKQSEGTHYDDKIQVITEEFSQQSLLIKALIVGSVLMIIFGIYKFRQNSKQKYAGYQQLIVDAKTKYGSIRNTESV